MLENQKCILTYGLEEEQLNELQLTGVKVLEITTEMSGMKLNDVLKGLKFEIFDNNLPQEKVVLFNSFSDEELHKMIKVVKATVGSTILAVVTPTSAEWSFSYLLEHLIEEREWYSKSSSKK